MKKKEVYLFSISSHSKAISINSLDITLLKPQIDFSLYDYLIITSKQASVSLSYYLDKKYIDKKALCISEKSAEAFIELGGKILELGSGYGDTLIDIIKKYPKKSKWLYLRAEVIASDFTEVSRNNGYLIDEVVLYRSSCSREILDCKVDNEAILIFTSPSSVKCFLKKHTIFPQNKIIVIGKTTAKALPKDIKYIISQEKTIQSCILISEQL